MPRLDYRRTDMDKETFDTIEAVQQTDKYTALNTYKIKLATTHSRNYQPVETHADYEDLFCGTESGNDPFASAAPYTNPLDNVNLPSNSLLNFGENNKATGMTWDLPAIPGNHITNCLIKLVGVYFPPSVYTFEAVDDLKLDADTAAHIFSITDFSINNVRDPLLYVECSSVLDKTFVSTSKGIIRKGILGSHRPSNLIKTPNAGQQFETGKFKDDTPNPLHSNMDTGDSDWILAANPFGSSITLKLTDHDNNHISIRNSKSGIIEQHLDAFTGDDLKANLNNPIDAPIIYELLIKLLPDNQSNDRFSY